MTMVSGRCYLEKLLIENASGTLAGLKCASIFNVKSGYRAEIDESIEKLNGVLNQRGVTIRRLFDRAEYTLLLVYSEKALKEALNQAEAVHILLNFGYQNTDCVYCLERLGDRFRETCCPHELGIFLGFPAEDVREYIRNNGGCCRLCGFWKVYTNEQKALEMFRKYRICIRVYRQALKAGLPLSRLTVAA